MLTIELMGGMGNQMFQWALGVALSKHTAVSFSASRLGPDKHRQLAIGKLLDDRQFALSCLYSSATWGPTIPEPSLRFHPEILDVRGNATLLGYWQTEKYFAHVGGEIRARFRAAYSSKLIAAIQAEPNSVFLHVRRTDYLAPGSAKFHGVLNGNYYGAAMNEIEARVPGAKFFVFSDDPEWCRKDFFQDQTVIETGSAQEDMLLMSYCRHGITANSTFSWWGAWLNPEQDNRVVISPRTWFADTQAQACSTDIVPERWLKR